MLKRSAELEKVLPALKAARTKKDNKSEEKKDENSSEPLATEEDNNDSETWTWYLQYRLNFLTFGNSYIFKNLL